MSSLKRSETVESFTDRSTAKMVITHVTYSETTTKQPLLTLSSPILSTQLMENTMNLNELNFTDRLTYLAWRKEWKAAYAKISVDIRAKKNEYKTCQRKVVFAIVNEGKPWQQLVPTYDGKPLTYNCGYAVAFNDWRCAHHEANTLLELLIAAKEKSGKQRAAMIAERFPEVA